MPHSAVAIVARSALITLLVVILPVRAWATSDSRQTAAIATLTRLAQATFGDLSEAELRLIRTAPTRDLAWASPSEDPDAPLNNPANAKAWGKERAVRAAVVAWILSDPQGSKYVHPSGIGLAAARISGKLDLSYTTSSLPLLLLACSVADGIDLSYSHLQSVDLRKSWTGPILADQSVMHGDVSLQKGRYDNASFFRSEIDGNFDASGGRFIGDNPVMMVDSTIKGDALFHDGFTTGGTVDFRLAQIAHSLSFHDVRFVGKSDNGLNAERANIGGTLYWVGIQNTPGTQLDLENAHAGSLWDDQRSWPAPGNLLIQGFVYGDFSGGPVDGIRRLKWLRLQPIALQSQPQPYRQLAHVLRENGAHEGAVRVEIAREDALTRYGGISVGSRFWRLALRATIGYGYRPLRALWWILLFVLVGTFLFRWGYGARLIAPTEESAYSVFVRTGAPPVHYPPFSSVVYSLENFLPVVDLHQGTYWRPNPHHRSTRARFPTKWVGETVPAVFLRWYLWIHILAGWAITPLLFAGLAGLLRND